MIYRVSNSVNSSGDCPFDTARKVHPERKGKFLTEFYYPKNEGGENYAKPGGLDIAIREGGNNFAGSKGTFSMT